MLGLSTTLLAACTPIPEPTPTALIASDEEAYDAAEETYRAYTEALNQVDTSDPETFEAVFGYTTGDFQNRDRQNLSTMHAERISMTGSSSVVGFKGVEVDDETVTAEVCIDVSQSDLVNAEGQSLVPDARPDISGLIVRFERARDGELRIARGDRPEEDICAPSM